MLVNSVAAKSLILLGLMEGNPPLARMCSTEKDVPQRATMCKECKGEAIPSAGQQHSGKQISSYM